MLAILTFDHLMTHLRAEVSESGEYLTATRTKLAAVPLEATLGELTSCGFFRHAARYKVYQPMLVSLEANAGRDTPENMLADAQRFIDAEVLSGAVVVEGGNNPLSLLAKREELAAYADLARRFQVRHR